MAGAAGNGSVRAITKAETELSRLIPASCQGPQRDKGFIEFPEEIFYNAQREGLFAHRTSDRGRDHFDHCSHRDPEPAAVEDVGSRFRGSKHHPYTEHG